MLHPGTLNKSLGTGIFFVKGSKIIFVLDRLRIRRRAEFAAGLLSANSKRNLAIFKIAATLVSFLVLKWRFRSYVPKLMAVADVAFERAEEIAARPSKSNGQKKVSGASSTGAVAMKSTDVPKRIRESPRPNPVEVVAPLSSVQAPMQVMPHWMNPEGHSSNYQYTDSKVDAPIAKKPKSVEFPHWMNPEGHSNNYQHTGSKVDTIIAKKPKAEELPYWIHSEGHPNNYSQHTDSEVDTHIPQSDESLERHSKPVPTDIPSTEFYPFENSIPNFYGFATTVPIGMAEQVPASRGASIREASSGLDVPLCTASATDEQRLLKEAKSDTDCSTKSKPERKDDAIQAAGSQGLFLAPRNLLFRRAPIRGSVSPSVRDMQNVASPSPAVHSPRKIDAIGMTVLPYVLSYDEEERITRLIEHGKSLPLSSSFLDSKEELLAWSGLKMWNPIEAYFLAGFLKVPHRTAEFADDTLTVRLTEWIRWAQTLTDV
jgi:hypothetical protein